MIQQKLQIPKGRTFRLPIRWESAVYDYAPIQSISSTAPCRVVTSVPHGLPDGWRVAVESVEGMVEINSENSPPQDADYRRVKVLTPTEVEFNDLNPSLFSPYTSGGYLRFKRPIDLTGCSALMQIRPSATDNTVLLELSSANGRIQIQPSGVLVVSVEPLDTINATWTSGVCDLEVAFPSGAVHPLFLSTRVSLVAEVSRA